MWKIFFISTYAVEYVERLGRRGFTFECLTSQSEDVCAGDIRRYNLEQVFGNEVITDCTCIATGADKDEYLTKWKPGHWWIEDKPANCIAGLKAGHKPILITHHYNKDFVHEGVTRADSWEGNKMIIDALRKKYEAEIASAKANINVYQTNPAGIGEHSDVVEAVNAELCKLAEADDRLEMISKYFK